MGVHIWFVVFLSCATYASCKVICTSPQVQGFWRRLFFNYLFVKYLHTGILTQCKCDFCGVVWYLNTFEGVHNLESFHIFYQEIMAENSFVGQFQILPNTSPSFHYNALIFFPSQFPICHGVHTKSAGTNGYLFSFFLVKYVSWSTCFFLSKIVLCTLSECILKPWGHKKFSV